MTRILLPLLVLVFSDILFAEPYLAVKSGQKCASCHVSPTGGGLRNEFGQAFGNTLTSERPSAEPLDGKLSSRFRLGTDYRAALRFSQSDEKDATSRFQTDRLSLYLAAELIPKTLTLYLDQQFAPASDNRTAWVMWQSNDQQWYLRGGKFFLPYGLRLEDDGAFIRQLTGINFSNADQGIEAGWNIHSLSTQLALTNGSSGAAEIDNYKQVSVRTVWITPTWRLGGSLNQNKSDQSTRRMANIFAAMRAFQIEWLFEIDRIDDENSDQDVSRLVLFAEINRRLAAGHNLKLTHEWYDPDKDVEENERTRNSLVWEYMPRPQLQWRTGLRIHRGIPQQPQFNSEEVFGQLHIWF